MKFRVRYALASLSALLLLPAASLAQSNPPAWSPSVSYKIGDLANYQGIIFMCLINESASNRPFPHTLSWGINYVFSGPLHIPVGPNETIKTLSQAYTYISGARIANNSSIEIALDSNYTESFSSPFSLDHPFGGKISIVGAVGAVANFSNKTAGFTLDSGFHLADLEGLEIVAPTSGSSGNPAIKVSQNSCLASVNNVSIKYFDLGVFANSGVIDNVRGTTIESFTIGAYEAENNSTINIVSPINLEGAGRSPSPASYGIYSATGSTISCPGCSCGDCVYNFYATGAGRILALNCTSNSTASNVQDAYFASQKGYILADGSEAYGSVNAYEATTGGYVSAQSSTSRSASSYDYLAEIGGIVDASSYKANSKFFNGTGSYVYGIN